MQHDYSDIPAAVYIDSIHEQLGDQVAAGTLDDSNPRFFNFVCPNPECGDPSRPNEKKAYIYTDTWMYVCYKCTPIKPYALWLKERDETAYSQLLFNAFGPEKKKTRVGTHNGEAKLPAPVPQPQVLPFKPGEIMPITSGHPLAVAGLQLCQHRRIREEVYHDWFVCLPGEQFYDRDAMGNVILNEKGYPRGNEYRNRIIIPFYKFGGSWSQFDARSIYEAIKPRYLNFAGVKRTAYNIDFINYDETIYILEGSIDSTFVRNSIAIGGIPHFIEIIKENPRLAEHKGNIVVLWDNDDKGREARDTTCRMGYRWFTWEGLRSKDINKAVMEGELPLDRDGYVCSEVLESRVRSPEGASIIFALKYGNMQKEAARKRYEGIRAFRNKKQSNRPEVLF